MLSLVCVCGLISLIIVAGKSLPAREILLPLILLCLPYPISASTMNVSGNRRLVMESYSFRNMYLIGFIVNVLYLFVGMTAVWTSPVIARLISPYHQLSMMEKSVMVSSCPLGAMLGACLSGIFVARYGHRAVFGVSTVTSVCSLVCLSAPEALVNVCVGRLLAGVVSGVTMSHIPIYAAEISDSEVLNVLKVLVLPTQALGYLLVYILGCHFNYEQLLYLFTPIPAFHLVCLVCLPESPSYYMDRGHVDRAKKTIAILKRGISTGAVEITVQNIQEGLNKRATQRGTWSDLLSEQVNVRALTLTLLLASLQSLSGPPIVLSITETLLLDSKTTLNMTTSLTTVGVAVFVISLIKSSLTSKWNCRNQLMLALIAMAFSMLVFGLFFLNLSSGKAVAHLSWVPLGSTLLFLTAFLIGVAGNVQELGEELCGSPLASVSGYTMPAVGSFFSFVVTFTFFTLVHLLGYAPMFWIFCLFCMLTALFVYLSVPDTAVLSSTDLHNFLSTGSWIKIPCSK